MNSYVDILFPFVGYIIVYFLVAYSVLAVTFDGTWHQWLVQIVGGVLCFVAGMIAYKFDYYPLFILLPYLGVGYIVCAMLFDWPSLSRTDDVAGEVDMLYEEDFETPQAPQLYVVVDNT